MPKGLEGSSKMSHVDYSSAAAGHLPRGVGAWPTNDRRAQAVRDSRMSNATSNCWVSLATITDYFDRRNNHIQLSVTNTKAVISNETSSCQFTIVNCCSCWFHPQVCRLCIDSWAPETCPLTIGQYQGNSNEAKCLFVNREQERHFFLPQKDTHVQISRAS